MIIEIMIEFYNKTVSVIVPVYNTEKYLKNCLDSIINQTYKDIEIILINDGSKDNSLSVLQEYEAVEKRIKVFSQENSGVSSARNKGIDLSSGEYILFIDSDDYLEPNMVEVLVNNLEDTKADISCCQNDYRQAQLSCELEVWNKEKALEEFMIHKNFDGQLTTKLFKRSIVKDNRFDQTIHYGEDALFLWCLLKTANNVCVSSKILYYRIMHSDSASGGGFKPTRMESHTVWNKIVKESADFSDKIFHLAKAQLGNMAFFSWYMITASHYENSGYTKECVQIVRNNLKYMLCADFIKFKYKVCACLLALSPKLAKKAISK